MFKISRDCTRACAQTQEFGVHFSSYVSIVLLIKLNTVEMFDFISNVIFLHLHLLPDQALKFATPGPNLGIKNLSSEKPSELT